MSDDLFDEALDLDDLDEEPQIEPAFVSVDAWVGDYFSHVINRKINTRPGHGLAWDPQWWNHSEVVARLTALWWAWEGARRRTEDRSAMSGWWVDHCEPHLRILLDGESGPMSGTKEDGTWAGHGPLPCAAAPDGWVADDLADLPQTVPVPTGEGADELPAPAFTRVQDFVESFYSKVINRKIEPNPGHGLAWDPRWWKHQEAASRLTALWWAFEDARAVTDDSAAMSNWWIRHCDPHTRVLLDGEDGPMWGSNRDGTWPGNGRLSVRTVPDGWVIPPALRP